ncbi:MAG: hypothetical protein E6Q97_09975 [Desulfurellales bacterium]|nr:MAG: hypothetical protein E6Q97_09975 [Desulfurellales bacterium]
MANIAAIDSPDGFNAEELFTAAKRIVVRDGGDVEEIATVLQISPRRARALYLKVQASLTVDDFHWTLEQAAAFARASLIQIASEAMSSTDPKDRKNAIDAIKELREIVKGADPDQQPIVEPSGLKVDVRSIIEKVN